jgi:hypothetical protein
LLDSSIIIFYLPTSVTYETYLIMLLKLSYSNESASFPKKTLIFI